MCLLKSPITTSNMDDIKQRFSGSLPRPRRCSGCQKMVYFSVTKCRECGVVTHKQCYNTDHRQLTKANSANTSSTSPLAGSGTGCLEHKECRSSKYRTMSDSSCEYDLPHQGGHNPGSAMTGLLRIIRWLSHRRRTKELNCKNNPAALEKHVKGRFGLHPKLEDKETKKKLKALLKSTQTYQRHLYNGFANQPPAQQQQQQHHPLQRHRFSSARSASTSGNKGQRRLFRSVALRSDSSVSSPRSSVSSGTEYATPFGTPTFRHCTFSPSKKTTGDEAKKTMTESKQNPSGHDLEKSSQARSHVIEPQKQTQSDRELPKPQLKRISARSVMLPEYSGWTFGANVGSSANAATSNRFIHALSQKTAANDSPNSNSKMSRTLKLNKPPSIVKAKTLSMESPEFNNDSLCATWPPVGKTGTIAEETSDEGEYTEACEDLSSMSSECPQGEDALKEWCVPYDDIEFVEKVRHGRHGDIFRGRWYGEVLIYTIRDGSDSELKRFLEDVVQMGMIRHENIVLFMGACIQPPRLAVITSMRKGPTLYEYVHLKRNRLPFHSKLNIARQIAQGMGYLHAKGITHRKLNSKNIFLESRVKLCMMDHAMSDKNFDRSDRGCIPRGQLSYVSPELMKTLQIDPPRVYPAASHTQYSDIFAFGSLLYELLAERFPFHDQHPHAIIWKVATGKRASLEHFRFINGLKALIRKCWSQTPQNRPPFSEIVNKLVENVSNHKRHSSVPDKLHCVGHSLRRNICT